MSYAQTDADAQNATRREVERLAHTLGKRTTPEQVDGWVKVLFGVKLPALIRAVDQYIDTAETGNMPPPGVIKKLCYANRSLSSDGYDPHNDTWKVWSVADESNVYDALAHLYEDATPDKLSSWCNEMKDLDPTLTAQYIRGQIGREIDFAGLRLCCKSHEAIQRQHSKSCVRYGKPATGDEAVQWHEMYKALFRHMDEQQKQRALDNPPTLGVG